MNSKQYSLQNILFIDIETVGVVPDFESLKAPLKLEWKRKFRRLSNDPSDPVAAENAYSEKAGIYAEFAKVVCISLGLAIPIGTEIIEIRLKSFYQDEEAHLLSAFKGFLEEHFNDPKQSAFCGHNIREFDIPFLCRRMIINGLSLPTVLDLGEKRPWQITHLIDTLSLWKFGDYKHYISLNLLATILDINSSKDGISGKDVHKVYWEENDLSAIVKYCEKDIICLIKCYTKLIGRPATEYLMEIEYSEEE